VYDPQVFKVLLSAQGRIAWSWGAITPVGEKDPVAFVSHCGVSGADHAAICGGNAARLLGLA